jgi:hypothetical protein
LRRGFDIFNGKKNSFPGEKGKFTGIFYLKYFGDFFEKIWEKK